MFSLSLITLLILLAQHFFQLFKPSMVQFIPQSPFIASFFCCFLFSASQSHFLYFASADSHMPGVGLMVKTWLA